VTKHEVPILTHVVPSTYVKFKEIDDIVVIAYLSPAHITELEALRNTAEKHYESFVFGYVIDKKREGEEPTVVAHKNTGGYDLPMDGFICEQNLEFLLEYAKEDEIGRFSEKTMNDYMAVGTPFPRCLFVTAADQTFRKTSWPSIFSSQLKPKQEASVASSRP